MVSNEYPRDLANFMKLSAKVAPSSLLLIAYAFRRSEQVISSLDNDDIYSSMTLFVHGPGQPSPGAQSITLKD